MQAEAQSPRYLLNESKAPLEVRIGIRPNLRSLFEIAFVRLVGTGDDKSSNLAWAKTEVAMDAAAEVLFHRRVGRVAIHTYQCLGEALDKGQDRNASALALSIEGVWNVLTRGFPQNSSSEVPQMVVMALKLTQDDPAISLPCNIDLLPVAGRAPPREGGQAQSLRRRSSPTAREVARPP